MFKTRLLSGILLVIIALATIISGDYVLFFTLLAVSLIGMRELYRAMKVQDEKINLLAAAGYLGAVLYYLAVLLDFERYGVLAIIFGLVLLMFVYVFTYPTYEAGQVMPALFGIVYVAVMLSFIYLTRELPGGKFHVWLIFLCSWGCDTCAYCVGMLIGKHKMAPVLSPKKSVEGAVGGVAGAALLGVIYAAATQGPMLEYAVICAIGALISMVGDLAASAIKRNQGIKDYGKLIPGHGGILDINGEKMEKEDVLLAYIEYLISLVKRADETVVIQSDDRILEGFRYEKEVEHFLKTAVDKDLFEVYYQPVFWTKEDRYITLEALSRLKHPCMGMIPPDVFISIAERQGLIAQIGLLQFRRVCRFIKENEYMMKQIKNVKFNLSPSELLKPGHSQLLIDIVKEYELSPKYFQFEITETVATEYSESFCKAVEDFTNAGIGLCLDDFGSGYANLNAVLRLPFDVVKMDRSLLTGITCDEQAAVFYHSIVTVMQNMGYTIVAEGAETEEEVSLLREWGVDMVQGYYFSRPLPEVELLRLFML